jgi:hypothetical protein
MSVGNVNDNHITSGFNKCSSTLNEIIFDSHCSSDLDNESFKHSNWNDNGA